MMRLLQRYLTPIGVALCLTATGCGSSSSDSSSSGGTTDPAATTAITRGYPSDLAITSPTASSSTASSSISKGLDDGETSAATSTPPSTTAQKEKIQKILNATDKTGCTLSVDFSKQPPSATCYGPTLNFTNHPDGATSNTQLPQGDLGIWTETEAATSEACVAAKFNSLVGEIITNATMAQELVAAVLCRARIAGKALPDKGVTQDLKTEAEAMATDAGLPMTFTTASIARAAADSGSSPVFTTALVGSVNFSGPKGSVSSAFNMNLKHIPAAVGDNSTYKGRLTLKVNRSSESLQSFESIGNCSGSNGFTDSMSIEYDKTSETALTYAMRRAEFCGVDANPFDSTGNVDFAAKKSASKSQGWANDGHYALANLNPADGSGNFQYAWQAGSGDGNTRVLNVKIDSGGATGCGYFGYGPDIAATSGVGSIDRIICNWAGPGNNHTGLRLAQRQCFTKSSGKYVSKSSNLAITYAPTNACNKTAAQNFSYQNGDGTQSVSAGVAVTNNLIGLSQIDVTAPTNPVVP